jgi:DNA gyrase subunit A
MGRAGIRAAYATGKGKIIVRGKAEIEEDKNGKCKIIISESLMVNKSNLVKSIVDLVNDKRIDGIADIVDHSSKDGMRIVVD